MVYVKMSQSLYKKKWERKRDREEREKRRRKRKDQYCVLIFVG